MKIKIILVLFLCFLTSGCWNYNELNDFAIVTGIGIDKHKSGYKVSLMISNSQSTQASSREGEAQTTVFTGTGPNINEALMNIETKNPRNLYLGHLAVAVIDEELAKEDINPVLETLMRNPESAKKYYLIIARENKAEDILKSLSPLEAFPSENISLNIKNASKNQGITTNTLLSDFIISILKPGINGILPSVSIQGEPDSIDNQDDLKNVEPKAMLKIRTIGLFKEFKLIDWTTEKESQGINIINNGIGRMHLTNEYKNNKYDVVLLDSVKTKIDLKHKDNNISVTINSNITGSLTETNRNIDLTDPKQIEEINRKTEENVKDLIIKGVEVTQDNKTDIFGFGNMLYKKDPKYFKKIKKDWDDIYYPNISVKVKVKVNIKSKGALETTIKEKNNEY